MRDVINEVCLKEANPSPASLIYAFRLLLCIVCHEKIWINFFVSLWMYMSSSILMGFISLYYFPLNLLIKKITVINWDWKLEVTTWFSTFCLRVMLYKYSLFHYRQTKNNGNPFIVWFWTQILFDFRYDLFFFLQG